MKYKQKNNINGVILVDKPSEWSSNDVIQKIKYAHNLSKIGHTGTLDPIATGLLVVCLGEATKFSNFLLDSDKEYIATIKLGLITDSGDREGEIIEKNNVDICEDEIFDVVKSFIGKVEQKPSAYSAIKIDGRPAYTYARKGEEIDVPTRIVTIYDLQIINYDKKNSILELRCYVSKGTYIRTLAEDIGKKLRCGASIIELRRTKVHDFDIKNALELTKIVGITTDMLPVINTDLTCIHLPRIEIHSDFYDKIKCGNRVILDRKIDIEDGLHRMYNNNIFLGVGQISKSDCMNYILQPKRLISNIIEN